MRKLFGTDGVRGIAGSELTVELAFQLGKAAVKVLKKERPTFIIGCDTRISGHMLADALASGIMAMGGDVIKSEYIPTPGIAYLVQRMGADAGVVISASHNPFEYNGIKFFNAAGYKLDDTLEEHIESLVADDNELNNECTGADIGRELALEIPPTDIYIDHLIALADKDVFAGMRIAVDCANGAAFAIAKQVFLKLGAEVTVIGDQPNGVNINLACGSTHPQQLQEIVRKGGYDIGLAFDGDADRLIAVDEKGELIDGDKIIYICAKYLKSQGELKNNLVTTTIMSNIGLGKALEHEGCTIQHSAVGDRSVLAMMQQTGSVLGGEQSGHIIFLNLSTTGDGILAAIELITAIKHLDKKPSELAAEIKYYPQVLKNASVKDKMMFMQDEMIKQRIEDIQKDMAEEGRVVIRPSGTEPLVRVMIEGKDAAQIEQLAASLTELIEERMN